MFTMEEAPKNEGVRKVRIKVVGVGGAGGNAINRMISAGLKGVEFIAVNTDYQDLEKSLAPVKVPIGQKITQGLGTGGYPERGENAAIEDTELLTRHLEGADLVFVTAGMGGGTGTGAAPQIARLAHEVGALTVAVVTKPFAYEGPVRERNAAWGLSQFRMADATLIVIPNENLFSCLPDDVTLEEAFLAADDVLRQGVQGISDLITRPGQVNLDFEDARTVLSAGGRAVMGMGQASGPDRAVVAAGKAANNPLLEDASIQGARNILVNIASSRSPGLKEVQTICNLVREKAHPDVHLLFGTSLDNGLGDDLRVTVVAAAFEDGALAQEAGRPPLRAVTPNPSLSEACAAAPYGNVPGVDTALPEAARPSYRGLGLRRGTFVTNPNETPPTPGGIPDQDWEQYQTPITEREKKGGLPFSKKRRT
ncbi:MAG: cell division protein FtsZ [Acidobacteriota bacterium]